MPAPIRLSLPDVTSLLPSSSVAVARPPQDNTFVSVLSPILSGIQKGVVEWNSAKAAQTEARGYADYYRKKGYGDLADLISLQADTSLSPDISGAIAGVDTNKNRQNIQKGFMSLGMKEAEMKHGEDMQTKSFQNQKALSVLSDRNITARESVASNERRSL